LLGQKKEESSSNDEPVLFRDPATSDSVNIFEVVAKKTDSILSSKGVVASRLGNDSNGTRLLARNDGSLDASDDATVRESRRREQASRVHEQKQTETNTQVEDAAQWTVERGPNGAEYATNGRVSIDVSSVKDDPEATILKMWSAQASALAAGSITGVDSELGSVATARLTEALRELAKARFSSIQGTTGSDGVASPGINLTA
jgi:hypothetical protein